MTEQQYDDLKAEVKSLHTKLDTYHKTTIENTTDISWLKRGMFGTFFTYIGAFVYTKFGG
jgi:uncharacterized protein YlxW (UPF0749 family)